MGRIGFLKGKQSAWINKILKENDLSVKEISQICGVSHRTFRDWRREKYTISEKALLKIHKKFHTAIPNKIQHLSDFWYVKKGARKGALRRMELYGLLGNQESRRTGGLVSQQRRRENPEKYRVLGCNVRKEFKIEAPTVEFAELAGILLGDGGISNTQVRITISALVDRQYAKFISKLVYNVFGEHPSVFERSEDNTINLTVSGIALVELLLKWGFVKGNKIVQEIDFPQWIWSDRQFQKACIRGLIDTDGGLYFHRHWVKGIRYRNLGLCFSSGSKPLLNSVSKVLNDYNIIHSLDKKGRLYIYSLEQIKKYFSIFGTNNSKNKHKIDYHLKYNRVIDKAIKGGVG